MLCSITNYHLTKACQAFEIEMISPMSDVGPLGMVPKMKKFRVTGYFEAGMYEYDANLAFINIREAQKFFNYDHSVTGIEVRTTDLYQAAEVSKKIESLLSTPYYTRYV